MSVGSILELVVREMDELGVPECDLRRVTIALAEMIERPDRPGHIIAASRALTEVRPVIRELYEPKTPLEEQRDYERARRLCAKDGINLPPWCAENPATER